MKNYIKAKKRIEVTPGESVRIIRELQELSQNELSELTLIPQSTISAIERDRINLGVERAKVLARAPLPSCCSSISWLGHYGWSSCITTRPEVDRNPDF